MVGEIVVLAIDSDKEGIDVKFKEAGRIDLRAEIHLGGSGFIFGDRLHRIMQKGSEFALGTA